MKNNLGERRSATHSGAASEGRSAFAGLHVAYLINQYPKVSHSFIRREIQALERRGVTIDRIAIRGWDAEVVDPEDRAERKRTRYLLADGLWPLLGDALRTLASRPRAFLSALRAARAMARTSLRPLPYHLIYLAHACRVRAWTEAAGVSHLHAHFGTNGAEIALLAHLLGGPPYSFTAHGADEADDARHLALDRKVAGAKFAVGISAYTRSQLLRHVRHEDWQKVKVVHCGLEPAFVAGDRPPAPETPSFLSIGRFSGEKGQLILLEAFARLLKRRPDCRLVLAGDGELRPVLEARIRALGIGDQVRITGWITSAEVREKILATRALVQPSFQEGLPVVIMEAMALERPVISTYVAGIPELVIPGENGWLVPAGSERELADAMQAAAATSSEALTRMGKAARERALARHSIDTEAAKLAGLFAEPLQGSG